VSLPYAYLKGTPFELLFNTEVAFEIPRDRWPTHCVILAPSEWGKSQLTGLFLREATSKIPIRAPSSSAIRTVTSRKMRLPASQRSA
jgi:hypothetical protein